MRRRFFIDRFESSSAVLRGEGAEHLGRVLRAEPGQLYELSDGQSVWLARVERVAFAKRGDSRVEFALIEPVAAHEPRLQISLLIAIVKFDRFEWCLEKATELGAAEIVPLAAARSDKPLIAAAPKRWSRWEKILLESSQQSRRLRPPVLRGDCTEGPASVRGEPRLIAAEAAFARCAKDVRIILSERPDAASMRQILEGHQRGTPGAECRAALAIGPEGGWAEAELTSARQSGFAEASLGENILRTETAVIAAMSIAGFALG